MKEPVFELEHVHMRTDRGGHVFRDLNLKVEPEQSAVIVGSSGCGKTSLAELLVGLRFPQTGEVKLFGETLQRRKKRVIRRARKKIGGVGGPFGLLPSLTVSENITLPLVIAGERQKLQRERLLRMLSEFSLLKVAGKYPENLTRVEYSLVQFARAAIANQPLIIIDEPSAGLDPKTYRRVFEFLVKVALSGRSMLILASEPIGREIPGAVTYNLVNGELA
ncbi:MAG: ATP-binding cassette domain-containing protein [bacterium]|nr:ATP-binding cassette domain-containing protein [bacterium]